MLSNFFIPKFSKQFRLKNLKELKLEDSFGEELHADFKMEKRLPVGLCDSCKINREYKELVEFLEIATFSNEDTMRAIVASIRNNKIYEITENIWKELEDNWEHPHIIEDQHVTDNELKVVVMWRTTKLGYNDIAAKLNETSIFVKDCIKNYKKFVREQKKLRKQENAKRRRVIGEEKIVKINEYCWKNRNKQLTIAKIKEGVWKNKDFQHLPWNSTISKVLKKKLKMSYRTLSTRHPKSIQGGQKQLFLESALIQMQLSQKSIQLIFVDEFNLTWRN